MLAYLRPNALLAHAAHRAAKPTEFSPEVQALATVLEYAWSRYGASRDPRQIHRDLEVFEKRFPGKIAPYLTNFKKLEGWFEALEEDPKPEWLRLVLEHAQPQDVQIKLTLTCLLVVVPPRVFDALAPDAAGITHSNPHLPEELRGRIVVLPKNADRHTYKHEIIHTLEVATSNQIDAGGFPNKDEISEAKWPWQVEDQLPFLRSFPKQRAYQEIVAYEGSERSGFTLQPYGVNVAAYNLTTFRQGLTFNSSLDLAQKDALYRRAHHEFRQFVYKVMALREFFLRKVHDHGHSLAVADALIHQMPDPDYALITEKTGKLADQLDRLLSKRVPSPTKMDELCSDINHLPHPLLAPFALRTILRTNDGFHLANMIRAIGFMMILDEECLAKHDLSLLIPRLRELASFSGSNSESVRTLSRDFLRQHEQGLASPSYMLRVDSPEAVIARTVKGGSAEKIIDLFRNKFPNRHPIWSTLPLGFMINVLYEHPPGQRLSIDLAIAEHSSSEFEFCQSVYRLFEASSKRDLDPLQRAELRRVADMLPDNIERFTRTTDEEKSKYIEQLTFLRTL